MWRRMFVQRPQRHSTIVNGWLQLLLGALKVSKILGSSLRPSYIYYYAELRLNDDPTVTISVISQVGVKSTLTHSRTLICFKSVSHPPKSSRQCRQGIRGNQSCARSSRKRKGISANNYGVWDHGKRGTFTTLSLPCERMGSKVRSRLTPSPN